ncbi:hypothetical protein LINPERPRIM_LOCUS4503, partial [Linum perenne]
SKLILCTKKTFCIHSFNEIESCDCAVRCVRRSPAFVAPLRFDWKMSTNSDHVGPHMWNDADDDAMEVIDISSDEEIIFIDSDDDVDDEVIEVINIDSDVEV